MMPFPGGVSDTANGTLLLSLLMAVAYGFVVATPPSLRRTIVKTGTVALVALLALLRDGPALLVAALALSAVGDAALSRPGERAFLAGLTSFLLAHLAYVALFISNGGGLESIAEPWRLAVAVLMTVAVAGLLFRLWRAVPGDMRGPVAGYAVAILAMGLAALTMPSPVIVLGAALFMASDALLATGRFLLPAASPHRSWLEPGVWVLYVAAQFAIALALLM